MPLQLWKEMIKTRAKARVKVKEEKTRAATYAERPTLLGNVQSVTSTKRERKESARDEMAREKKEKQGRLPEGPTVFVGNLNYEASSDKLEEYFSSCGEVKAARIMTSGKGKSKGAALVVFSSDEEKQRAIENLNKVEFEGRELTVREWEAIKKEDMLDFSALEGDGDLALLEEDESDEEWDDDEWEGEGQGETGARRK
jgi:hypothetical protein